jgi:hypothetical protein
MEEENKEQENNQAGHLSKIEPVALYLERRATA